MMERRVLAGVEEAPSSAPSRPCRDLCAPITNEVIFSVPEVPDLTLLPLKTPYRSMNFRLAGFLIEPIVARLGIPVGDAGAINLRSRTAEGLLRSRVDAGCRLAR